MTDHYGRWLADRVSDATPSTLPPFEAIRRRARRDRLRSTGAVVGSAALVASVVVGGWSLQASNPGPEPSDPVTSPSSEDSTPVRPEPTFERTLLPPSGLVIRLPERDVDLPADGSCWTTLLNCQRAMLPSDESGPDVGTQDAIEFWFAKPGWTFSATFRRAGENCSRATTVDAVSTTDQWFRLDPADGEGSYEVRLSGEGPEGTVSTRFVWTTTSDGPVEPPRGDIALFPKSSGEGTYGLEVRVADLPFHPEESELSKMIEVNVTSADGLERTLTAPLIRSSLDCRDQGTFYYQAAWNEDISTLGADPLLLETELTIRGTTYVGRATWSNAKADMPVMEFQPPLPTTDD